MMNEDIQKYYCKIIQRELQIDQKVRMEIATIWNLLPLDKMNKLKLAVETIQNRYFKAVLVQLSTEVRQSLASQPAVPSTDVIVRKRIDEIIDFNMSSMTSKELEEVKQKVDILDSFDKNKYC